MRKPLTALSITGLAILLSVGMSAAQWSQDNSSLLQNSSGGIDPNQPSVYYPYWHNYLDNMQREGGYYSVTGNYPNSAPVTSYYPASPSSEATSPQAAASGQGMFYNPQEYYAGQGYSQPQQPVRQQQYYQQAPQQQALTAPVPAQTKRSSKKNSKQAQAAQYEQQYGAAQQQYYQQPQQQYYNPYAQQPPQAAYQQPVQQAQTAEPQNPLSNDPAVQAAQQKAYERAAARQKAAELAAQQQAVTQELQQAQQQYALAQQKVKEQELRQKQVQEDYRKKAVQDAYESLRVAQQRYYELMGVTGESGPPRTAAAQRGSVQPGGQALVHPQMQQATAYQQPSAQPAAVQQYPAQPQQFAGVQPQAQPSNYGQAVPQALPQQQQQYGAVSQTPPVQTTPLRVEMPQQQQQQESGLWSTLKEIFAPPTTVTPNPRKMFEGKKSRFED